MKGVMCWGRCEVFDEGVWVDCLFEMKIRGFKAGGIFVFGIISENGVIGNERILF